MNSSLQTFPAAARNVKNLPVSTLALLCLVHHHSVVDTLLETNTVPRSANCSVELLIADREDTVATQ